MSKEIFAVLVIICITALVLFAITYWTLDQEYKLCLHISHRFRKTKYLSIKLLIFSYSSVLTYVLGAQKNRLVETVLVEK